MEAWRRGLDEPVRASAIARVGPAHVATLKTFDPPPAALEGRRFEGAERRGKRLLFPTDDGDLVLLVHLMTAGRLKYLKAGEAGPKTPTFQLAFAGGSRVRPPPGGGEKRGGGGVASPPEAREGAPPPRAPSPPP